MKRVFIDTSVLFSACNSRTGAATIILGRCRKGAIQGYISSYVLSEIKRNVAARLDQVGKKRLHVFLQQGRLTIVEEPGVEEVKRCERVIAAKDAPVLAASIKCNASHLLTFNTTDFKRPEVRAFAKPLEIMTPREFITSK